MQRIRKGSDLPGPFYLEEITEPFSVRKMPGKTPVLEILGIL